MEDQNFNPKLADTNQKDIVCSNCAAKLVFEPGTTSLACPYCGTLNEIEISQESIDEMDFDQFLKDAEHGKDIEEVSTIACDACGAVTSLDKNVVSSECPFCGNKLIVKNESTSKQIKPKSLLPFKITSKDALESFKTWLKKLWFAPPGLKKYASQAEKIAGMYLPYWTYDSDTFTNYKGERGDNYTVTESYTDGNGKNQTRTVTKTRWTSVYGSVSLFFDDVLVLASKSLPQEKTDKLEPWDLENLIPFDEKFLSGFRTESYGVSLKDGFVSAKAKMDPRIRQAVNKQIGGDQQRISFIQTTFSKITFKHTLLPIWISAYRFNDKVYRFIVNGRTGKVQGERPWCWWKIALLVVVILGAIGAAIYFGGQ
jgi:LSD1 subclass zinc finger protein